ncbi:Uncharacterized protein FKW44_009363, partial [Caligus rogercresseyi]
MARAGNKPADIIKTLGYPKATVYDVIKRWKEKWVSEKMAHASRSLQNLHSHFPCWLEENHQASTETLMTVLAKKSIVSYM